MMNAGFSPAAVPHPAKSSAAASRRREERSSGGTPKMKLELATDVIGDASHALFSFFSLNY
jgi:hypothetical protein